MATADYKNLITKNRILQAQLDATVELCMNMADEYSVLEQDFSTLCEEVERLRRKLGDYHEWTPEMLTEGDRP